MASTDRILRQIRLEPTIAKQMKVVAEAWVIDDAELYDQIMIEFLNAYKDKPIVYLSQPKDEKVTNVRLLNDVFLDVEKRADIDKRSIPNIIYTAFIWFAKNNNFDLTDIVHNQ